MQDSFYLKIDRSDPSVVDMIRSKLYITSFELLISGIWDLEEFNVD